MAFANEGTVDRLLRLIVGLGLAYWAWQIGYGTLGIVVGAIAAIAIVTSVTGFCPAYRLFGCSTRKTMA
jgi:hypothetical protein